MEDGDTDDSIDSASCQQRPKVLDISFEDVICFLFRIDYDMVRAVHSIFQSTCARCSSYPWCCAALCIRWTCHMVPSGVHEKDMADTPKIVLAYSVIEETEARRDYIQDGTIFGRLLS